MSASSQHALDRTVLWVSAHIHSCSCTDIYIHIHTYAHACIGRIGIDPWITPISQYSRFRSSFKKKTLNIVPLYEYNLVDEIWGKDRPALPPQPLTVLGVEYTGCTVSEKLEKVWEYRRVRSSMYSVELENTALKGLLLKCMRTDMHTHNHQRAHARVSSVFVCTIRVYIRACTYRYARPCEGRALALSSCPPSTR